MGASAIDARAVTAVSARGTKLCEACGERGVPLRPALAWKLALGVAWCSMPVMLLLSGMSGLGMTIAVPIAGVIAAGTLGPLHEKAFATPRCPHCRRYMYD